MGVLDSDCDSEDDCEGTAEDDSEGTAGTAAWVWGRDD